MSAQRRLRGPLVAFVRWSASGAAAVLLLGAVGLELLGRTGVAADWVELQAARALEPTGLRLEVRSVGVRWLAPGLQLRGVRVRSAETGQGLIEIERLGLDFSGPFAGPPRLEHVRIDGAELAIGDALYAELESARQRQATSDAPRLELPAVELRRLRLILVQEDRRTGIGEVDFDLEAGTAPRTGGTFRPGEFFGRGQLAPLEFDGAYGPTTGLEVRSSVRDLELDARTASGLAPLLASIGFDVARVTLDADAELRVLGGPATDRIRVAAQVRDLRAGIAARPRPLEDGRGAFEVVYDPARGYSPLALAGWDVRAGLEARIGEVPLQAELHAGASAPRGSLARLDLDVPYFGFDEQRRQLLEEMIGEGSTAWKQVDGVWSALAFDGAARLGASFVQPVGDSDGMPLPLVFASADPLGELNVTYHGFPGRDGLRRGFPVTAEDANARIGFAFNTEREMSWRVDWGQMQARQPDGEVFSEGTVAQNPDPLAEGYDKVLLRLGVDVPRLRVGPDLRRGLAGLRLKFDFDKRFAPKRGEVAARVRMESADKGPGLVFAIDLDLAEIDGAFEDFPLPFHAAGGQLALRYGAEGRRFRTGNQRIVRPFGMAWELEALGPNGEALAIAGTRRSPDLDPRSSLPPERGAPTLGQVDVAVEGLEANSSTIDWLLRDRPEIAEPLALAGLSGALTAAYRSVVHDPEQPLVGVLELESRELECTPLGGTARLLDLGARLLLSGDFKFATKAGAPSGALAGFVTRATLAGRLDDSVQIGAEVARLADGRTLTRISASGLDPNDLPDLPGIEALQAKPPPITGAIDLFAEFDEEFTDLDASDLDVSTRLRDNRLEVGRLQLTVLDGEIRREDGLLRSDRLSARLERTAIRIDDFEASNDPGDSWVRALVFADDLPLDLEHLSNFMPAATIEALEDRALWRGSLDVRGLSVEARELEQGGYEVDASGDLVPHNLFLDVGLPLAVRSAELRLDRLVVEGQSVRGYGAIEGLYASLAERVVSNASAVVSFAEGRLTIGDLSSNFAGGELRSFGARVGGGIAVAMDVMPPYRFELSLELAAVKVAQLLEGMFAGGAADRGELDMVLRLAGTPNDLLGLEGSGRLRLFNARLFSVPVVRQLFSVLGLATTATFDEMATRIRLDEGVIHLDDAYARSPLVTLIGGGTLDLDGTLRQDFELTYSIVDALGPFSKLLYLLQNSLLRVSVRGDMGRPKLKLTNFISDLLTRDRDLPPGLPLPPQRPLPDRF